MRDWIFIGFLFSQLFTSFVYASRPAGLANDINPGSLIVLQTDAKEKLELPLKHTRVNIQISGFIAKTTVIQQYHNPLEQSIEAIYTFPLPNSAAIDKMQMRIGNRLIKAVIKKRDEAKQIYQQAKAQGKRTVLLEQQRPNVFTQSVANILPNDHINIEIQYVQLLDYQQGSYELVFPMVVGPRYYPKSMAKSANINPVVLKPDQRSGHDIEVSIDLEAGLAIQGVHSSSHAIEISHHSKQHKSITLHPSDTIPNKDFILRYEVADKMPTMALLSYKDERGGFFSLMIQPQKHIASDEIVPRELIFVLDTSGSMRGFPLKKSKQAMIELLHGMREQDRFNVVRFAGDTSTLWSEPQPYNRANVKKALNYVQSLRGSGGTEMRKGILDALNQPAQENYLRIAILLSDGYIGNEQQIFKSIDKERKGARVFTLGIGSSVNRYLLDRAADIGRGQAFYLRQDEASTDVIKTLFQRIDKPTLTEITIDWQGLDVFEIYPKKIPDLWEGQPIQLVGRYQQGGKQTITIQGQLGQQRYQQSLDVDLTADTNHQAIASIWARNKVKALMQEMVRNRSQALIEQITQLGLNYHLMTQWTSFVAVEHKIVNSSGDNQTIEQAVELPEGVSYEGIFGQAVPTVASSPQPMRAYKQRQYLSSTPRLASVKPKPTAGYHNLVADQTSTVVAEVAEEKVKVKQAQTKPERNTSRNDDHANQLSCEIKALSVSGNTKYPQIHATLESYKTKLCRTLPNSFQGKIHLHITTQTNGKVSMVVMTNANLSQKLKQKLKQFINTWRFANQANIFFVLKVKAMNN